MGKESCYMMGRKAFLDGRTDKHCPFPSRVGFCRKRLEWFNGYYEARVEKVVARAEKGISCFGERKKQPVVGRFGID